MSSKAKRGRQACNRLAYNNRQWVIISRRKNGDCPYCPPNAGDNLRKRAKHSSWGRKRAVKRYYATGKTRNKRLDSINQYFCTYGNNCYYDKGIAKNIYKTQLY